MSDERVTYAELNVAKGSTGHRKKPKGTKGSTSVPEKEVTYADLTLGNAPRALQGSDSSNRCKGSAVPPEKLVAGLLGLLCLVLMCSIIAAVMVNPTPQELEPPASSGNQTASSAHHCGPCPEGWVTYSNSCYYLSDEGKTWNESVSACAARKSHLLYIDNQGEMNYLQIFNIFPWVGVSRRTSEASWLWANGSEFTSKLFIIHSSQGKNCAYFSFQNNRLSSDYCSETKKYMCKHRAHAPT